MTGCNGRHSRVQPGAGARILPAYAQAMRQPEHGGGFSVGAARLVTAAMLNQKVPYP
jgi:hypothetical protein